jgi:uncharacterized protein (DUF885 family)
MWVSIAAVGVAELGGSGRNEFTMTTISFRPFTARSVFTALLLSLLAVVPLRAQTADTQLENFFKDYLDSYFRQQPLAATQLGDHRFDDQLEDLSPSSREGWLSFTRSTLRALPRKVDYKALSRAGQIDFEIFRHDLETTLWLADNTRPFEDDPRTYGGYINDSIYTLFSQSTLPKETNIRNALARMAKIPDVIRAAQATLKHPPRPILETAIRQNRGAIAFYQKDLFDLVGETPQLAALKAAAAPIAAQLQAYQKFLEGELMARATGDWRLGKKRFARKLELVLDAGFTAEQVSADAEAEFTRVNRDLYVVARQLWSRYFPKTALPPDDVAGRRETIAQVVAKVSLEHGAPDELVGDARATVDRIKTFIRERDILRLPDPDRCQVIEMPEFKRGNSLAYMESAPPLEPAAVSIYAVSPPPADWSPEKAKTFLEEYNQHMLQVLTIHEAYPGHYVQLEYANRTRSQIRRVFQSGAFVEGWAVYTEQTMLDEGYGEGDLRLRLMQLKFYLRAVANAILDQRMHCTPMTDDEAFKFLTEGAFQSEGEARLKIIRAKQSSTQLSTYFVGRMAHYRLRQEIERELGERFELGRYHEAVIAHGSIPTKYLPELVRSRLQQPR